MSVPNTIFAKINNSKMYQNDLYLAVITKQAEGLVNKSFNFINYFNQVIDKQSRHDYLATRHKELCESTRKILNTLSDYGCDLLSVYEKNGIKFSAPLEFLSELINFDKSVIPLEITDASIILPRKRLFFNRKSGAIEMRASDSSKKFIAMLSIKAYSPVTYQGILNKLSILPCEYVITQSFRFYDRQVAKNRLRDQQKDMMQSKDESISQTDQIDEAFDDAASGEVGYGMHHFTLACYADSQEELNKQVGAVVAQLSDVNIACLREDVASESVFWAQLPGNFGYIVRAATISTKNMVAFASFYNQPFGKLNGSLWGEAVTVFETLSGSPYYFNFHYKDVGNFLVFGSMGSGKTVLIGFLILQSMKFSGKRIIFDKDRGLEIMVRAMGGNYETLKPGVPTGFNPCQLNDTPTNRKFLLSLFQKMLSRIDKPLLEHEVEAINNAIVGLFNLDPQLRQLCHLASFFGAKKVGSLRNRFEQWHSDGTHAWLFDNHIDSLNLDNDVLGFDLGSILAHEECKTPALMYLTYRIENALAGKRGILFIDEGWNVINDDYFKGLIDNWSRTPRKKDNIFGLATQVANDTSNSLISKSINESSYCKFFFPNSAADRKVYIEDLGLSEYEYEIIKSLPDDKHYFLLNYGRSSNKESVVVRLNLTGLSEIVSVISARESTLILLDQIRSEVGDDPEVWLPIFYQRCKKDKKQ